MTKRSVLTTVLLAAGASLCAAAPAQAGVVAGGLGSSLPAGDHSSLLGSVVSGASQAVRHNVVDRYGLDGPAAGPGR